MNLELTEDEMRLIMERRMKTHTDAAYNQGLIDSHTIVQATLPMGEQRQAVLDAIKSLHRA
jgi:hypothetical protein